VARHLYFAFLVAIISSPTFPCPTICSNSSYYSLNIPLVHRFILPQISPSTSSHPPPAPRFSGGCHRVACGHFASSVPVSPHVYLFSTILFLVRPLPPPCSAPRLAHSSCRRVPPLRSLLYYLVPAATIAPRPLQHPLHPSHLIPRSQHQEDAPTHRRCRS
jgi:hypothetical protein